MKRYFFKKLLLVLKFFHQATCRISLLKKNVNSKIRLNKIPENLEFCTTITKKPRILDYFYNLSIETSLDM